MKILMPEVKLKTFIDVILGKIRNDYVNAGDKTTTFLYKMYGDSKSGNYVFLDEAVKIFTREGDDPRIIDTRLLYDRERANMPTIHVTIPSESPYEDALGFGEGDVSNEADGDPETADTATEYYVRGYRSKFELMITGSNTFEVILIFTTLKAALINNVVSLELNGFRDPKIFGADVKINDQMSPNAYMRILNLDSFYKLEVPKFDSISVVRTIGFEGTAY